jgi:NAD(P)-dependent dehydrogenase (short-subunit alcohol dehydrogenase family)
MLMSRPSVPAPPAGHGLLAGKIVLVTAAAGTGIGSATARRALQEGARVAISDRHERRLAETAEALADVTGEKPFAIPCDVTVEEQVQRMVAATVETFGRLDVLVNNAAVVTSAPFWELSEQQWTAVVDTNLSGVWRTTAAAVGLLRRSPRGRIVNIASTGGVRAVPEFAHYVAAKHGVVGLTRAMAIELAGANVTVNAIAPGAVDSPMLAGLADELGLTPADVHKRWLHDQLLMEVITPAEVTGALLWLLSDAARHVTGHCLAVDGGALAR